MPREDVRLEQSGLNIVEIALVAMLPYKQEG